MPKGVYKHKSPWNKGKHYPAMLGNKHRLGKPHTEEIKKQIKEKLSGKKRPPFSEKWKTNMSKSMKGKYIGKNNPNWRGGITFNPYPIDWTETLRRSIRERDHYTCQLCGELQSDKAFSIHHIDYDKKNCNPDNLITLCVSCHIKTSYNRQQWKSYFQVKVGNLT